MVDVGLARDNLPIFRGNLLPYGEKNNTCRMPSRLPKTAWSSQNMLYNAT